MISTLPLILSLLALGMALPYNFFKSSDFSCYNACSNTKCDTIDPYPNGLTCFDGKTHVFETTDSKYWIMDDFGNLDLSYMNLGYNIEKSDLIPSTIGQPQTIDISDLHAMVSKLYSSNGVITKKLVIDDGFAFIIESTWRSIMAIQVYDEYVHWSLCDLTFSTNSEALDSLSTLLGHTYTSDDLDNVSSDDELDFNDPFQSNIIEKIFSSFGYIVAVFVIIFCICVVICQCTKNKARPSHGGNKVMVTALPARITQPHVTVPTPAPVMPSQAPVMPSQAPPMAPQAPIAPIAPMMYMPPPQPYAPQPGTQTFAPYQPQTQYPTVTEQVAPQYTYSSSIAL
eukprot:gnl/Dysnectes_brevis/3902_a5058_1047.p1 GENE.gnl/Dysnectes_brevis/3902_a5058_1047~~gnl/Dysnectes_brevis/3902_a5058_1047.p1  ORF type:complete len:341 (+),score=15.09 gnl/Dysnectes_brevis/3902_a5058_1047:57-1079(+)